LEFACEIHIKFWVFRGTPIRDIFARRTGSVRPSSILTATQNLMPPNG
jgi:hypothetical protein